MDIDATDARQALAELLIQVQQDGQRIRITRDGQPVAALISAEELNLLEALENEIDVAAAKKALARDAFLDLEDFKWELGL